MTQTEFSEDLLSRLIVRRQAIDHAIREVKELLLEDKREDEADVAKPSARSAARPPVRRKAKVKKESAPTVTGSVNERDASILTALTRHGGVARSEMLRKSFKPGASLTSTQEGAAFRNALQRLKVQGKIRAHRRHMELD